MRPQPVAMQPVKQCLPVIIWLTDEKQVHLQPFFDQRKHRLHEHVQAMPWRKAANETEHHPIIADAELPAYRLA